MRGALVFTLICTGCLGFVIFATGKAEPLEPLRTYPQSQTQPQLQPQPGKQSLSGLRRVVRGAEPLAVPPVRLDLLSPHPTPQPQPQPQPQPYSKPQP